MLSPENRSRVGLATEFLLFTAISAALFGIVTGEYEIEFPILAIGLPLALWTIGNLINRNINLHHEAIVGGFAAGMVEGGLRTEGNLPTIIAFGSLALIGAPAYIRRFINLPVLPSD